MRQKHSAIPIAFLTLWLTVAVLAQPSQTLVVHHNANLRASASTQSAIVVQLVPGDEVVALSSSRTNGFWRVRTSAGLEGWIYETLVHQDEIDEVPTVSVTAASTIDPAWPSPAPVGSVLPGPLGKPPCPAIGEAGGDLETNRRKNRKDVAAVHHPITFSALADLPYPDASTNRKNWTATQLAEIAPFEGRAVSIVGYLVAVKKQSGGDGEATNCHFNTTGFTDVHVALVEHPGDGEKESIVVEPTPRFYGQHPTWQWSQLKALDDQPTPVRISGWVLMDPVHKGHLNVYRKTLWEIHPVTKIEIFKNGAWVPW